MLGFPSASESVCVRVEQGLDGIHPRFKQTPPSVLFLLDQDYFLPRSGRTVRYRGERAGASFREDLEGRFGSSIF